MPLSPKALVTAVMYQVVDPPIIDGARKPMKPGGYRDSGADIAFCLWSQGLKIATDGKNPNPECDLDWVFPDNESGLCRAIAQGANVLWANTVLFDGHPLQSIDQNVYIVGQEPLVVHKFDNKWHANSAASEIGNLVARSVLVSEIAGAGSIRLCSLNMDVLKSNGLVLPLVVKPVRGRGSAGVKVVRTFEELHEHLHEIYSATCLIDGNSFREYGQQAIVEEFLPGEEITLTIMPPGEYKGRTEESHWHLPPVKRSNHRDGLAPYNGVVAVTRNSKLMSADRQALPEVQRITRFCTRVAKKIGARAPIRVDCRARESGDFMAFDINMKPNMTGSGRPGREDQDSLSCIAARGLGWSYNDLLLNMLMQAWPLKEMR